MSTQILLLFVLGMVGQAFACTSSGWTPWINDNKPTTDLFPEEKSGADHITHGGGEKENMTSAQREQFCPAALGYIKYIDCVSTITKNDSINLQGPHATVCDVDKGFTCHNRFTTNKTCLDYKIRFYCNCTGPISTASPSLTVPDHCASSPCIHGKCYNLNTFYNKYFCNCDAGHSGKICDVASSGGKVTNAPIGGNSHVTSVASGSGIGGSGAGSTSASSGGKVTNAPIGGSSHVTSVASGSGIGGSGAGSTSGGSKNHVTSGKGGPGNQGGNSAATIEGAFWKIAVVLMSLPLLRLL